MLADPRYNERMVYFMVTMVQHHRELAAAYFAEFGFEPVLDDDCPHAGYQWIKGLFANDPVRVASDAEVARLVSEAQVESVDRIGICGSEQLAKVARGELELQPLLDVLPTPGLRWRTYVAVVAGAPRPHAACLLVQWLFGDQSGGGGYSVWRKPGFYPGRHDMTQPEGAIPRWQLEPLLWDVDVQYVTENLATVRAQIFACSGVEITLHFLPALTGRSAVSQSG